MVKLAKLAQLDHVFFNSLLRIFSKLLQKNNGVPYIKIFRIKVTKLNLRTYTYESK